MCDRGTYKVSLSCIEHHASADSRKTRDVSDRQMPLLQRKKAVIAIFRI